MTSWRPRPRTALGVLAALLATALTATPAQAIPLLGIGGDVGVAGNWTSLGPGVTLNADLAAMGPTIGLIYWRAFNPASTSYTQLGVRYNVSPVPMVNISPGVSVCALSTSLGGLATLNASFAPIMLPVALEASVGAGYCNGGMLLPYSGDLKLSLIPFTAIKLGYRGWSGGLNIGGPELGIEIGL